MDQPSLFDDDLAPALPPGMRYQADFLGAEEERDLVRWIQTLPLAAMRYKQYTARRRVLGFGGKFDYDTHTLGEAPPIPPELFDLRERAARWSGHSPEAFQHALVAEYAPGTPLGWHRDVPDFEDVVGISLWGEGVMRFRPYPPERAQRADTMQLQLAPRSIYLLHGPSRWDWQHAVPPTRVLRYSITLRTLRSGRREPRPASSATLSA